MKARTMAEEGEPVYEVLHESGYLGGINRGDENEAVSENHCLKGFPDAVRQGTLINAVEEAGVATPAGGQ